MVFIPLLKSKFFSDELTISIFQSFIANILKIDKYSQSNKFGTLTPNPQICCARDFVSMWLILCPFLRGELFPILKFL